MFCLEPQFYLEILLCGTIGLFRTKAQSETIVAFGTKVSSNFHTWNNIGLSRAIVFSGIISPFKLKAPLPYLLFDLEL